MKRNLTRLDRTPARRRWTSHVAAAGLGLAALAAAPHAGALEPPPVPSDIVVPADHRLFRAEHAVGTQNYVCLPSTLNPPVAWLLHGPQATLFRAEGRQNATHFLSPNPDQGGALRATWQDSRDSSAVWAVMAEQSSDPAYVHPDAIAWLLLDVVGTEAGPKGGRSLTRTASLQRINTVGGKAPATGCATVNDIGNRQFVPYEADYLFYKSTARD